MIVNTVVPPETTSPAELADPGQDEFAVAGRIGPDAEAANHGDTEAPREDHPGFVYTEGEVQTCTVNITVERQGPTYTTPIDTEREEHSATVDLTLVLLDGLRIELAQTGPDFLILPTDHGQIINAGTKGNLYVVIDGKGDPVPVELTSDVDFSTTRVGYRRLDGFIVVQSQTGLSKAEQERLFWEEVRLLGELRENESQRDQLNCELATAKNRQRELQAELNNLSMRIPQIEEAVEECCEDTLTYARALWRLKAPASTGDQPSPQPAAIESPAANEQPALPAPSPVEESTEWRNLLTAELLAGIKGLGKKKLETICELAPTVGHLEDLRGQASREHKQYNEVLPDGCGAGVAQMIEDRLVKHIADCAKRSAGGNPLADELLNSFRQKVASESWQATDCVPDSNDTEQTHLGFAAFNEGKPHTALPTQNPELARQWMLGWVCAEVIKHAPPVEQEAAKQEMETEAAQATEAKAKPPKKPRKPRTSKKAK